MTIEEHATTVAGKPVVDWQIGTDIATISPDPAEVVYAIRLGYEESQTFYKWTDKFAIFLNDPAVHQVTGIVVGSWDELDVIVAALVAARDRLPHLTALFLGDIIREEYEISWITQTDVSSLFTAYPNLEHLRLRGGNGLSLGRVRHERLTSLIIESGGLPASVLQEVTTATLPALEHLELWLGDEEYGANTTIDDIAPLLFQNPFPNLRYLGLRNSEIADEIAFAIAQAPVLQRITVLDLSLGTLGDVGAAALLESAALAHLEQLDLHHHFCSTGVMKQLAEMGQRLGITIDLDEQMEADIDDGDEMRFVAVSE